MRFVANDNSAKLFLGFLSEEMRWRSIIVFCFTFLFTRWPEYVRNGKWKASMKVKAFKSEIIVGFSIKQMIAKNFHTKFVNFHFNNLTKKIKLKKNKQYLIMFFVISESWNCMADTLQWFSTQIPRGAFTNHKIFRFYQIKLLLSTFICSRFFQPFTFTARIKLKSNGLLGAGQLAIRIKLTSFSIFRRCRHSC